LFSGILQPINPQPMRHISTPLLTLLAVLLSTAVFPQTVTLSKTAQVGCPDTPAIHGPVMAKDRYGNFYLASTSFQGTINGEFQLAKFDRSGNVVWTTDWSYPGPVSHDNEVTAMTTDRRGNVIITGTTTFAADGITDILITTVSFAPEGQVLWSSTSGIGGYTTIPTCITTDSANNIFIAGSTVNTTADFFVEELDSTGSLTYGASYDGTAGKIDQVTAIATDASGNVYVTGESMGQIKFRLPSGVTEIIPEGFDYVTIKYNHFIQPLWTSRYASTGADIPTALTVDAAGNVYVTGSSNNFGTTVCYNSSGAQQWVLRSTTAQNYTSIALDPSGNPVTAGYDINAGALNYDLTKCTAAGSLTWSINAAAGPYVPLNFGPYLALAIDRQSNTYISGEAITSGTASPQNLNFLTQKYTSSGVSEWSQIYNCPQNNGDVPSAIAIIDPSTASPFLYATVYVGGFSDMGISGALTLLTYTQTYRTIIRSTDSNAVTGQNESLGNSTLAATLANYPNPFRGATNISYTLPHDSHVTLRIYDLRGRSLATPINDNEPAGPHTLPFNAARLTPGVYEYRLVATSPQGNFIATKQMIIE
jgi:hypothetical protein